MRIRTDRLPSEYTELTSITSTGTQYINTEYFWQSENVIIEAEFKVLSNSSYQSLWGSEEPYPGGDRYFAGIPHGSNGTFGFYIGTGAPASVAIGLNSKVKIKMQAANNKLSVWKDNSLVVNQATINGHINNFYYITSKTQNSGRIYIFANHNSGSNGATATAIQQIGSMELFSFKMYDNGKLVRNFIPAKRNSDCEIGLYETTRRRFHTNIGTGTFTAGDEVQSVHFTVPTTYQRIEYLQSTGTQYIDLPFGFERTDKIYFDMSIDIDQINDKYMIAPSTWNNNNNRFAMGVYQSLFTCGFGNASTGLTHLSPNTSTDGERHKWEYKNSIFTIKDLDISYNGTSNSFGGVTTNLKLFYGYNANTNGKIYEYIHWKNDEKIIHLLPVKRKSDNVLGLYDLVNGVFYTNSGTGTFIAGDNISSYSQSLRVIAPYIPAEYQEVEYIKNSGTQYIDTLYTPSYTNGFKVELDFSISATGYRYLLLSTYNQGNALSLEIKVNNYLRLYMNNGNLDTTLDVAITANTKHKAIIEFDPSTKYYTITLDNQSRTASYTTSTTEPTYSMYMFVDRALRYSTFTQPLSIYKCKLYKGSTLVKELTPCYKKSDNTIGMYDSVNNRFHSNGGSGVFTKGSNLFNTRSFKPRSTILPIDYQQVDYIANSGSQCINTLYKWTTNNTKIIADFTVTTNSSSQSLWGNEEYYSGSSRYFSGVFHGSSGNYQFFVGSSTGLSGFSVTLGTRTKIEAIAADNKYTIIKDGTTVIENYSYNGTVMAGYNAATYTTNSGNFFIFANHNSGSNGQTADPTQIIGAMKLYSFKMYDNNVLVRDYIPCYRKSDSVIGLYDLVTRTFFTNAGSGTFSKGSNVNNFM